MSEMREVNNIYLIAGGAVGPELDLIQPTSADLLIAVDSGAEQLFVRGLTADYFLGDFDSLKPEYLLRIEEEYADRIVRFPAVKNETDSELALNFALEFNPAKVMIYGATGSRIDHIFANINILLHAEYQGVKAIIYDANNRIQLLLPGRELIINQAGYSYLSLLAFADEVEFIQAEGLKYPLVGLRLKQGYSRGLSNELTGDQAKITTSSGVLLVIESKD